MMFMFTAGFWSMRPRNKYRNERKIIINYANSVVKILKIVSFLIEST